MVSHTNVKRLGTPKKSAAASHSAKKPMKPNASILNFFQKVEKQESSLFVGAVSESQSIDDDLYNHDVNDERFNESLSPVKRRRVVAAQKEPVTEATPSSQSPVELDGNVGSTASLQKNKPKLRTPFIMESDTEDEEEKKIAEITTSQTKSTQNNLQSEVTLSLTKKGEIEPCKTAPYDSEFKDSAVPLIPQHSTDSTCDETECFAELDELDLDKFEGEEMRERRFMQEQARIEAEEEGNFSNEDFADDSLNEDAMIQNCPICNESLMGVSADDASRHVNSCLDGNPTPISLRQNLPHENVPTVESGEISKRFAKAAVPRPGQANPFEVETKSTGTSSAFSKLMSSKVEDTAWATAAAAETASRGRPSYERTCPFYKIMPGFSICVDAFRYGAIADCNAYFLSHFHSDHYIGLTSNWRHGPIYCSKATGNLVKKQLRTTAKYVVQLDFDKQYDIPGTGGATVTMIPANHCPGSSMFIFEKAVGNGTKGRVKRILHCGDFRACPEHVNHRLLKPDILDPASSKLIQQKIDICYLDTTYLNPRYSFPPQSDVIEACADLCSSMSPDPNCANDIWEVSQKGSGTPAVSKYFQCQKQDDKKAQIESKRQPKQRLLVICGTYSIGKERICVAIAHALKSKIFATPAKRKICEQLEDPELNALLTSDATEAQVHMQSLMEIRAETLQDYLDSYRPHFSRIIGFRPSGWNYRPSNGKAVGVNTPPGTIPTPQILHSKGWKTSFGYKEFVPQRGSTKEAMCFGVPYSEHSSFRELALFIMSLRIEKVIPTVNVGSETSRKRMKAWIDRWMAERRRGGLVRPLLDREEDDEATNLWDGKSAGGGLARW